MFNLSPIFAVDRPILKCDSVRYTPPALNPVNGENIQVFSDAAREYSVFSLKDCYLDLDFDVIHRAGAHV